MNKTPKSLIIVGIIALCSLAAFGQEIEIDQESYWAAMRRANEVTNNIPVRSTQSDESYENGIVTKRGKRITERIFPDLRREFYQSTAGGKTETTEAIEVGGKSYCRENKKPWKLTEYYCGSSGLSGFDARSVLHAFSAKVDVDGKSVTLYRLLVKQPANPNAPRSFPDVFEYKTWIDADGRTIREELKSSLSSTGAKVYSRTEIYEYYPKGLKIEAPIK